MLEARFFQNIIELSVRHFFKTLPKRSICFTSFVLGDVSIISSLFYDSQIVYKHMLNSPLSLIVCYCHNFLYNFNSFLLVISFESIFVNNFCSLPFCGLLFSAFGREKMTFLFYIPIRMTLSSFIKDIINYLLIFLFLCIWEALLQDPLNFSSNHTFRLVLYMYFLLFQIKSLLNKFHFLIP